MVASAARRERSGGDAIGPPRPPRCRCGRYLDATREVRLPRDSSALLRRVIDDPRFCSELCLHAFLLESLERLDGGVVPWVVTDADRVAEEIRWVLASGDR